MWLKEKWAALFGKKTETEAPKTQDKDEELFETLGKNKKRKRRKIIITVVSIVLVLAIAAVVGVSLLQKKVRDQFASNSGEVKSYVAATGSISTGVSGSGAPFSARMISLILASASECTA